MTGAFFRVYRNGKFENIEVEHMTNNERNEILEQKSSRFLISLINHMCSFFQMKIKKGGNYV